MQKWNWKHIAVQTFWVLLGVSGIVLLGAAMQKKEQQTCKEVHIEIEGPQQQVFIDEKDVLQLINSAGNIETKKLAQIDLKSLETALEKNLWIKNAELFLDNKNVLNVRITEREPVARVFTADGESFYVDSNALRLPLSDKLAARVPVFTNFSGNKQQMSIADSAVLKEVVAMGNYIMKDSFWMAQVSQIYITPGATFEIVPTLGDELIEFGSTEDLEKKFNKLYSFYKQAWLQNGINRYEKINLQYKDQVVAVLKGSVRIKTDTTKASLLLDNTNILGSIEPARNNKTLADSSLKLNKKLIDNKQNKKVNKTLSNSRGGKEQHQTAPSATIPKKQPKAVMLKQ